MACKWYKINERKYTLQVLIRFTCFSISRVGSKVPKSTGFQFCHWAAWNKLLNLSGLQFICKIKLVSSRLWWFLWILALVFSLDCFSLDVVFLFQRYLSEALGYQLMEKWKLTFKKKKKKPNRWAPLSKGTDERMRMNGWPKPQVSMEGLSKLVVQWSFWQNWIHSPETFVIHDWERQVFSPFFFLAAFIL